ncbi:hypothetical protein RUM44_013688 [Polyplax serrata]|uniref:Uncharacterized protein n=1 Tax=Polyplax serrata TaxID=468196 RepID=A0ABR1BIZ2_POLSC
MSEDKWPTFFGFAWLSGGNTSRVAEAQVAQGEDKRNAEVEVPGSRSLVFSLPFLPSVPGDPVYQAVINRRKQVHPEAGHDFFFSFEICEKPLSELKK